MSALTEQEVLSRFEQSMKEARDACAWLARNADPEWLAPRGRHYRNLTTALKELEGCAKQMCAFRDDTRWLPLGILYGAKAARLAQKYFTHMNWLGFRELTKLFDQGQFRAKELTEAKTGRTGIILPKRYDWLHLPDHRVPTRSRLLNTVH